MECKFCGYCNGERVNAYGTFCPKCGEHVSPPVKVPFTKFIEEQKLKDKEKVLDILRKKVEGDKNANRD